MKFFINKMSLFLILSTLMLSCLGPPASRRNRGIGPSQMQTSKSTPLPTTKDIGSINFIQNGNIKATDVMNIASNTKDVLYLRGNGISDYLSIPDNYAIKTCLVVKFQNGSINKIVGLALTPWFSSQFSTNTREYYYIIQTDRQTNQTSCQTSSLTEVLGNVPSSQLIYSFNDICNDDCAQTFLSSPLQIYTMGGQVLTTITVNHLKFNITAHPSSTSPMGTSCTESSTCTALKYDCCLDGQCAKNGTLRPGIDINNLSYINAQTDITTNPAHIINYPGIFYICPAGTPLPSEPGSTPSDPVLQAQDRLDHLQDLLTCTTADNDGIGICTLEFENAYSQMNQPFLTRADDRNFKSTYSGTQQSLLPDNSIVKIIYGNTILYSKNDNINLTTQVSFGAGNDTLTDSQSVTLSHVPANAQKDKLKISYQIDGTCQKISSVLAKCSRIYIQDQNIGKISDHFPENSLFLLPSYADLSKSLNVYVDDMQVLENTNYQLTMVGGKYYVEFKVESPVLFNQKVKIDFFVNLSLNTVLSSKQNAQDEINVLCPNGNIGQNSSLAPQTQTVNGTSQTVGYSCLYPPSPTTPPTNLDVTVTLNSTTAPMRYFDVHGVEYTGEQISAPGNQEGTTFAYTSNNFLKPNNINQYIGYQEVYGSLQNNNYSPQSAQVVNVSQNQTYDIIIHDGSIAPCTQCGVDYYPSSNKLFPATTTAGRGEGYIPDTVRTNRFQWESYWSDYRSDDLLFGRACFVPLTMIPWSHKPSNDMQTQRLNRLQTQHFLFSNGYNRDWYGFDYGSVIGSFDGARWFSIGAQRRIKATSNRLYLAINAYFNDLTVNTNYHIQVTKSKNQGTLPTTDFDTTGARCQQYHLCNTDSDCITQLGFDYVCENVSSITTSWPQFDSNGMEKSGMAQQAYLVNLIGGLAPGHGSKRCIYKGHGSICDPNYTSAQYACSQNNYCQSIGTIQNPNPYFNTKISRFGLSPANQNSSVDVPTDYKGDIFGLAAHLLGRPLSYQGYEAAPTSAISNLSYNNITSLCIHGKDPMALTFKAQHQNAPIIDYNGDKVLGMGMSMSVATADTQYLSSCSILDENNTYLHISNPNQTLDDPATVKLAGTQAISTNILEFLGLDAGTLTHDFASEVVSTPIYQKNRCLRAPGAVCFTDQDCAPSSMITTKTRSLTWPTVGMPNEPELKFWQEELVCSNSQVKFLTANSNSTINPKYDLKNNRCCRNTGKTLTIYSDDTNDVLSGDVVDVLNLAGIDKPFNYSKRYSRIAPVYSELKDGALPALITARIDQCGASCATSASMSHPIRQYKTFNAIASKTCCSGGWIRNFHINNGGGHAWDKSKFQSVTKSSFKCLNWLPKTAGQSTAFACTTEALDTADCPIKNFSADEAQKYLEFLASLELIGIPQVLIKTNDALFTPSDDDITCSINSNSQASAVAYPIPQTIKPLASATPEYVDDIGRHYYSAYDFSNFQSNLKQVFSDNEITCCLPAKTQLALSQDQSMCCTGMANNNLCCLPDYTDITLYLNRYVSSEANKVDDSEIDPYTGYINSTTRVQQMANSLCCSGAASFTQGYAVGKYPIPLASDGSHQSTFFVNRFAYFDSDGVNEGESIGQYEKGLHWTNHWYCVPPGEVSTTP